MKIKSIGQEVSKKLKKKMCIIPIQFWYIGLFIMINIEQKLPITNYNIAPAEVDVPAEAEVPVEAEVPAEADEVYCTACGGPTGFTASEITPGSNFYCSVGCSESEPDLDYDSAAEDWENSHPGMTCVLSKVELDAWLEAWLEAEDDA